MCSSSRENNKIILNFYAPVLCNVTIMYATSSTNGSSLLADAYFVASFQNDACSDGFTKDCSLNDYTINLI